MCRREREIETECVFLCVRDVEGNRPAPLWRSCRLQRASPDKIYAHTALADPTLHAQLHASGPPPIFHHGSVYRTELPTSVGKRSKVPGCSCSWAPGFMPSRSNCACVTYIWIRAWGALYAAPACITLASNHTASPWPSNNLTIVAPSFESKKRWPPDCRDTSTVPGAVPQA